jgi:hypothetical protein
MIKYFKMKKVISGLLIISVLSIFFASCLKDKGVEDHKYGITPPGDQPPGIGFPEATVALNARAVDLADTPQVINFPLINLDAENPAPQDIHVNLIQNDALIDDYNTNNPSSPLTLLPASAYSISSLKVVILKGTRSVKLQINIPNAKILDVSQTYGLAFSISSVDESGYTIPANFKNVLVAIAIKNPYDGIYSVTGESVRGGDPSLTGPFGPFEKTFVTAGATAVQWIGAVYWAHQASQLPAGYEPKVTIDPITNKIIDISSPNGAIVPTTTYDQHYDPATRTLYFQFTYGGGPTGPSARLFTEVATYLRPR